MLNISLNSVNFRIDSKKYSSFRRLEKRSVSSLLLKILIITGVIGFAALFLPWRQNIRAKGYVTTQNPFDRPQEVMAVISGRIEQWKVKEGDVVAVGDTLAVLSEVKEEYMDPELIQQTSKQVSAKNSAAEAYLSKIENLNKEYSITERDQEVKLNQNALKIQQVNLEIEAGKLELEAAETKVQNATNQFARIKELYEKGIKSLTDQEQYQLKLNQAIAKKSYWINTLEALETEVGALKQNNQAITNSYQNKLAKLQSSIASTRSEYYNSIGEQEKLQSKLNMIQRRSEQFVIVSPIHGTITKTQKNGIGEIIKEGESLTTIVPKQFKKAVELYVSPIDVPLLKKGKKLRLLFDGWPAIVFSGWPNSSYGTFGGVLSAIDNDISENGKYRVLITEDPEDLEWPQEVRVGGGANGIILLNRVPVYYEIWRQMNGFPADYYTGNEKKNVKSKAPIKKVK